MSCCDYQSGGAGISDLRVRCGGEPLYHNVPGRQGAGRPGRVVHVEEAVRRVLGVKRDAEEAALAAEQYSCRDVQKWRRLQRSVPDHPDSARLLDDEYRS